MNRAYNKSDYLPCIAWGRNARFVKDLKVGDKLEIYGRVQSRNYQKKTEDDIVTKTAYEISISSVLTVAEDAPLQTEAEIAKKYVSDNLAI